MRLVFYNSAKIEYRFIYRKPHCGFESFLPCSHATMSPGWSRRADSNRRPAHYECAALPPEPRRHILLLALTIIKSHYSNAYSLYNYACTLLKCRIHNSRPDPLSFLTRDLSSLCSFFPAHLISLSLYSRRTPVSNSTVTPPRTT